MLVVFFSVFYFILFYFLGWLGLELTYYFEKQQNNKNLSVFDMKHKPNSAVIYVFWHTLHVKKGAL